MTGKCESEPDDDVELLDDWDLITRVSAGIFGSLIEESLLGSSLLVDLF